MHSLIFPSRRRVVRHHKNSRVKQYEVSEVLLAVHEVLYRHPISASTRSWPVVAVNTHTRVLTPVMAKGDERRSEKKHADPKVMSHPRQEERTKSPVKEKAGSTLPPKKSDLVVHSNRCGTRCRDIYCC